MGKASAIISFVMGALSLVLLAQQGLAIGLVEPLRIIVQFYEAVIEVLLGWANTPLSAAAKAIAARFHLEITLLPHWKHILIPMWLYVGADCRVMWSIARKRAAIFFAVIGSGIALAASVAAATAPIDDPWMRPVLFPVLGLFLFNFLQAIWDALFKQRPGQTRWQVFWYYAGHFAIGNLLIGAIVIAVGALAKPADLPGLSLLLLLLLVALIAARDLLVSAFGAAARRKPEQTWWASFANTANARLGGMVLGTLGAALAFLTLNAGLGLAGL